MEIDGVTGISYGTRFASGDCCSLPSNKEYFFLEDLIIYGLVELHRCRFICHSLVDHGTV